MRETFRYIFRGAVVIYPVLFAVFPILFLYACNIREMSANQIVIPLVVSVLFTLFLWAILYLILRNIRKAGLATTTFLFLFFSYGRFYGLLEKWDVFVPNHGHFLPAVLLVFGYCIYFIKLARRDFMTTTKILNTMAVVLIVINLFNIGSYQVRILSAPAQPAGTKQVVDVSIDPKKLKTMPDIYFIVLDEYSHPDTMKEWYGYDNSWFIESLKDKGFFVANKSRTRSPHTPLIIAEVLNMEYLTPGWYWDETKKDYIEITSAKSEYPGEPPWSEPFFRKYACNKVADFLGTKGYKYIYFGTFLDVGRWDSYMKNRADLYYNYYETTDALWVSEFQNTLWSTTMLRPFYPYLTGSQYESYYRRGVLNTLAHLKEMPSVEGPKFVFAHLMCPHPPFVFGPNGESIASTKRNNFEDKQFYLGQYIFINREIEKVVNSILKSSINEPIIVIQSDHGIRPHYPGIEIGNDEWRKILNVYYLPGGGKELLYDSISPVNSFRVIFNYYFDAEYDLLEDWKG
jgi:hypothetical protein